MSELEYDNAVNEAEAIFLKRKKELAKQYAIANNKVEIGEIISDHIGSILVDKILFSETKPYPSCVYLGVVLNKNGTKSKRGERRNVYQSNLIKS